MKDIRTTYPAVTVLMSVYNGQRYLREAIDSILGQTYKNIEFLIVNDGSTDDSRGIILSYCDSRIRLLDNPTNIGLTRSLNRGLAGARGMLVARQDADDVSVPERLEKQAAFLDVHKDVAMVGSRARHIDENGRPIRNDGWEKATTDLGIRWQFLFDSPFVHSAVMFRRGVVWEKMGGYDENFVTSQDFELWSRMAKAHRVSNLPDVLVDFRIHRDAVSARYKPGDLRKVEAIFLENVQRYLGYDERFREWPGLWTSIMILRNLGTVESPLRVVDEMETMYARFLDMYPESAGNREIRRYLAGRHIFVATQLASRDRTESLRAFAAAYRADSAVARSAVLKYLLLLVFGDKGREGFRSLKGLLRGAR
jgi:glycosyltransferase involved in cell wall biosynthesis